VRIDKGPKSMEKRSRVRLPRRLTCQIQTPTERVSGFVRDVSRSGFFVQTGAMPPTNSLIHVLFPSTGNQPELRIEAGVARKREIARRLQSSVPSGLGLEVIPPRDTYERWVFGPVEPGLIGSSSTTHYAFDRDELDSGVILPEQSIRTYRFRMLRHDQSASRMITIQCASEAGARARALVRAGAGWKIADAQAL
jgi:hypothetical protein